MLDPTRGKNEGKNLGRKHLELSERRRAFDRKKRRGERAERKIARIKYTAARARSRLDELTFGTFNLRTAAANGTIIWVVWQSPEQLRKMMGEIVVVCAAFGLNVSEAKTEIMCLRTKKMPESTATFSVEAAGHVYTRTNEFVYLERDVNHIAGLSIEVNRRIRKA